MIYKIELWVDWGINIYIDNFLNIVTTRYLDSTIISNSIIYNNNKILIVTSINYNFFIMRFNTVGSLDNTFGSNGTITTDLGGNDIGSTIIIDSNNQILVGGTKNNNFAIARYNNNGSLDISFGINGYVVSNLGGNDYGYSINFDNNKKIILGGTSNNNFAIARYNEDGSLDTTFGQNGTIITDLGNYDYAYSIIIDNYNKILLGGTSNYNFAIVRYNS